jgi:hypothetical protein
MSQACKDTASRDKQQGGANEAIEPDSSFGNNIEVFHGPGE